MNIFNSDKAPYAFGILVTVIGWHVSQIANEITRTQAVSYSLDVDRKSGDVVALIHNVSRTKSLQEGIFSIACAGGEECLTALYPGSEIYGEVRPIAPNATSAERRRNTKISVSFANTIAAGGRYRMVARLARPDAEVNFYFVPRPDRPLDIFIYDRRTITGFFVENYLILLIGSFLVSMGLLLFSVVLNLIPSDSRAPAIQESENGN